MPSSPSDRPAPAAEGKLAKTPVANLLLYAYDRKLNGTVELVVPDGERASILFIDGQPGKVRTTESVVYLGRVLLELGFIDQARLDASLLETSRAKRLHGRVLVEQGAISEAQLMRGLAEQLRRKLKYVFGLPPETTFAYYDAYDALHAYGGDEIVQADPFPLVWTAIREHPPWEQVSAALNRVATMPLRVSRRAELARFGFSALELELIDLLRARPMKVSDLAALGVLRPRDAQLLAYCLVMTKQVAVATERDSLAPPEPARAHITSPTPPPPVAVATPSPPAPSASLTASEIAKLEPALRERRAEILERAKYIDREDYFQMLDVKRDASSDDVKAAFFKLAKTWHPDRLAAPIGDARDACSRVFARMNEAYGTLTDPKKRENYMKLISEGGATPEAQATIVAVVEAATAFQKAEVFLKRNDLQQAEQMAKKAVDGDPDQPDYIAMLAWLEALKPANQTPAATAAAIAKLDTATKLSARCERAFFYRGMLNKRLGDLHAAARDFRKAAELNPRNIDAVREVRLYEMRSQKGSIMPEARPGKRDSTPPPKRPEAGEKSGIFGKLFKK